MIYLTSFVLPSEEEEWNFHMKNFEAQRSCYNNFYPFGIFFRKEIDNIFFKNITILSGSNGSGKSTLLNVIAEKLCVERYSIYNKSSFFKDFLKLCRCDSLEEKAKENSRIITSDDVFDYLLSQRTINEDIDERKEKALEEYYSFKYLKSEFKSLEDKDRVGKILEARRLTSSKWVKKRIMKNTIGKSNGESALDFFLGEIKENALYLLDEPENSLSPKIQLDLVKYIEEASRYFNCQFIIATHSPIISSCLGAKIYDLDREPFREISYEELESVMVYRELFKKRDDDS